MHRHGYTIILFALAFSICVGCADGESESSDSPAAPSFPEAGKTVFVTASSGLRMRAEPASEARVIELLPLNAAVTVLERSAATITVEGREAHWYRVRYKTEEGWVFSGFLTDEPISETVVRANEIFSGTWQGTNQCEGQLSHIEVSSDHTFTALLFGGCDISGCDCIEIEGEWRVEQDRICFVAASHFSPAPDPDQPSCYAATGNRMIGKQEWNPFVENYGSEPLTRLSRASDD